MYTYIGEGARNSRGDANGARVAKERAIRAMIRVDDQVLFLRCDESSINTY